MKKLMTALCVATLSLGSVAATAVPTEAAQFHRSHRDQGPHFESHGNYAYYNGQKGFRTHYSGYRYYNGYYFPPAAFVAGALIFGGILGGIIASQH